MPDSVRRHYEMYPYPHYPLLASVRKSDTYALNLPALWSRFNGELPTEAARRVLIAGCGSFSPYPFAVANPGTPITALDLSPKSLRRARMHCLVHGVRGVDFVTGDLLEEGAVLGTFGLIDAFGVLHHLADPLEGLRTLAGRLCNGGILRVMVYSKHARREEESIRRALRLLRVHRPEQVLEMAKRSKVGSRLGNFFEASEEMGFRSGIADALLHPCVHTFTIDPFLKMVAASGLTPLLFAHASALPDCEQEAERIRALEAEGASPGNFILYLARSPKGPCPDIEASFSLNPCLADAVSPFRFGPLPVAGRLGHRLSPLDAGERRFLRRFRKPVPAAELSGPDLSRAGRYADQLFLLRYRRH